MPTKYNLKSAERVCERATGEAWNDRRINDFAQAAVKGWPQANAIVRKIIECRNEMVHYCGPEDDGEEMAADFGREICLILRDEVETE